MQRAPRNASRFYRFTLRTMFAALTIFCILLGYWRYQVAQHRSAVEFIRRAGGTVEYDYEHEATMNWLIQTAEQDSTKQPHELRPLSWHARLAKWRPDEFAYVWYVGFAKTASPSEAEFAALRRFSRLEVLRVGREQFVSRFSLDRLTSPSSWEGRELEVYMENKGVMPSIPFEDREVVNRLRRMDEEAENAEELGGCQRQRKPGWE